MGTNSLLISIVIALIGVSVWIAKKKEKQELRLRAPIVNDTIDSPVAFGYKCIWFAVKTTDQKGVSEIMGLNDVSPCNWDYGITLSSAFDRNIFITPVVDGWTLAVGWGLPKGDSPESLEKVKALADKLSERFGEAQFFGTHRVVEYHCWLKSVNGKTERVYGYLGESGENIAVEGEPTVFERQYNLVNTFSAEAQNEDYFDREDLDYPNEELVMEIAGAWSVNPQLIENNNNIQGLGLLGTLK